MGTAARAGVRSLVNRHRASAAVRAHGPPPVWDAFVLTRRDMMWNWRIVMTRRPALLAVVAILLLLPARGWAACCECSGATCATACFADLTTEGDCVARCNALCAGSPDIESAWGPDSTCGAGDFDNCPTSTPTLAPTATPTPQRIGASCEAAEHCDSTFCADGVCCDSACDDPLAQCNLSGQVGTCAAVAASAPAASHTALLVMLGVLISAAFVALRLRRA